MRQLNFSLPFPVTASSLDLTQIPIFLFTASASLLSGGAFPFSNILERYSDVNLFLLPMADTLPGKIGKIFILI